MEKMGWRAQQGVACLLNRHWSLVLAFSFMNVSESGPPLRRARGAGVYVARAAPPSPWPMAAAPRNAGTAFTLCSYTYPGLVQGAVHSTGPLYVYTQLCLYRYF